MFVWLSETQDLSMLRSIFWPNSSFFRALLSVPDDAAFIQASSRRSSRRCAGTVAKLRLSRLVSYRHVAVGHVWRTLKGNGYSFIVFFLSESPIFGAPHTNSASNTAQRRVLGPLRVSKLPGGMALLNAASDAFVAPTPAAAPSLRGSNAAMAQADLFMSAYRIGWRCSLVCRRLRAHRLPAPFLPLPAAVRWLPRQLLPSAQASLPTKTRDT